jgi:hypothetical protein
MLLTLLRLKLLINFFENKKQNFNYLFLFIFLLLGAIAILNHAMWRDELNVWTLTRDSSTFDELLFNIKYEGHPPLWYLCLYFLNQFSGNPVVMQIFHLLLATTSAYLFLAFSPFKKLQKILFIFGYLPFYEYLTISRNYAIGLLCVFLFCVFFEKRKRSYILISVILALMANTNAYCLFIAIALGMTLSLEYFFKRKLDYKLKASSQNIIISLIIFIVGIIISTAMLIPPMDSTLAGGASQWMLNFNFQHLLRAITRIWNSYILVVVPGDSNITEVSIFAVLSLGLLIFTVTIFIEKPIILFFYAIATLEILIFTYVKFLGITRHYGHLYIVLISSLWLANYYAKSDVFIKPLNAIATWLRFVSRYKTIFIMVILCAQLVGGIVAFGRDLLIPYSASRETAQFIQEQKLESIFMVGSEDFAMTPVSGYLNRKIYYPEIQKLGSFVLFNGQRRIVDDNEVLKQTSQIIKTQEPEVLLILNSELKASRNDLKISFLAKFTNSFIHNEIYYLYLVNSVSSSEIDKKFHTQNQQR